MLNYSGISKPHTYNKYNTSLTTDCQKLEFRVINSIFMVHFAGGGRDLATAVNFGKHTSVNNSLLANNQSNSSAKATTFEMPSNPITIAGNQAQPSLKHLIPAESILKPFLPKVNTASTRVHPPSTTTNITAASNAAMSYANAIGYGAGMKTQSNAQQG